MNSELLLLRQMLSSDQLPVIVLAGLFVAVLFRRDSISSLGLFRFGYIFFILSLVAPAVVQSFFISINATGSLRSGLGGEGTICFAISNSLGPILLAVSLMCILGSLMPLRQTRLSAAPQKHPLDE